MLDLLPQVEDQMTGVRRLAQFAVDEATEVEGVRVDRSLRGLGIGEQMMDAMIAKSRARGCKRITLLTDRCNQAAQRFYAKQGFAASGMLPMRLSLG